MKITRRRPEDWKDLQKQVAIILTECGFSVEVEKKVTTARGTVELDVYAEEVIKGRKYSIVCECKYWRSSIPQSVIHSFRTVVGDMGCNMGYIITTSDFQTGSKNATAHTNVELLTWEGFQAHFLETWYESYFSPSIVKELNPLLTYSEPLLPKWFDKMTAEEKEKYFQLKDKYDILGILMLGFTPYSSMLGDRNIPQLPLMDRVKDNAYATARLPPEILNETGYREFQQRCFELGNVAIAEFRKFRDKYAGHIDNEDE